jgi:Magnesium chelatase, subunit ChlI
MIRRYVSKISGPLDRIDIHIEVPSVKYKKLRAPSSAEDSGSVRQRLIAARDKQHFRSANREIAVPGNSGGQSGDSSGRAGGMEQSWRSGRAAASFLVQIASKINEGRSLVPLTLFPWLCYP